jgi:hypothetical protein
MNTARQNEILDSLNFIAAALDQPVQHTGSETPAVCAILRGDSAIARKMALAAASKVLNAATINTELYGVLNAVRVATKFGKPVNELLPRIEEVLKKAETPAA